MTPPDPSGQRAASLAAINAAMAEAQARSAKSQPMLDARLADLGNRARTGELGPEWERLQKRIDDGRTTLADALAGSDDDPDAVALRTRSREHVGRLTESALEQTEADADGAAEQAADERPDLSAVRAMPAELERRLAEIREMAERLGRAT